MRAKKGHKPRDLKWEFQVYPGRSIGGYCRLVLGDHGEAGLGYAVGAVSLEEWAERWAFGAGMIMIMYGYGWV